MLEALHKSKYKVLVQVSWGSVVYAMPLLTKCKVKVNGLIYLLRKSTLYRTDLVTVCILHLKLNENQSSTSWLLLNVSQEAATFVHTFFC